MGGQRVGVGQYPAKSGSSQGDIGCLKADIGGRFEGTDWRGNRIYWPGIPVTNAQSRRFRMVAELRPEAGLSDDLDEHWPLQ